MPTKKQAKKKDSNKESCYVFPVHIYNTERTSKIIY
jgi:hypothetical protein